MQNIFFILLNMPVSIHSYRNIRLIEKQRREKLQYLGNQDRDRKIVPNINNFKRNIKTWRMETSSSYSSWWKMKYASSFLTPTKIVLSPRNTSGVYFSSFSLAVKYDISSAIFNFPPVRKICMTVDNIHLYYPRPSPFQRPGQESNI